MGKRLTIRGWEKIKGMYFYDRFHLLNADEGDSSYRWGFIDEKSSSVRMIWVELNRNGIWDSEGNRWVYGLNYPNMKLSEHKVSSGWWSDTKNVRKTFGEILWRSL